MVLSVLSSVERFEFAYSWLWSRNRKLALTLILILSKMKFGMHKVCINKAVNYRD